LSLEFTPHIFVMVIFGIILGFIFYGERDPFKRVVVIALFLTFLSSLFGPAGRTAILVLPFVASFYYGWVIRGNANNIESTRNRVLFYLVALVFGLIGTFAAAFFFEI